MAKKKEEIKEEIKEEAKKEEELFIPKTKHKFLKILLAIILLGGIIAGGYFLYQEKFNNPKSIIEDALEKELSKQSDLLVSEDGKYKINGKENEDLSNVLNNLDLQFTGEIDSIDTIANIDINTKYKGEKLIDLKTYLEKNDYYILLDGIYDKYLKIKNKEDNDDLKEMMKSIKLNSWEIDTLTKAVKKAFKEEITKLDLKKENDTISIDGKTINVINNYAILYNNEVNRLASAIINNIANDNDVCSIIKKWTDEDGKLVLVALASEINKTPFVGEYRINFYTDRGIFHKDLVSIRQEITQSGILMTINADKINDGIIVSFGAMGMSISVKITKNSSNYNLNLTFAMMDQYANIDVSVNYEKINEITKPDVSKSKKIEDLTETEKKRIEDAFKNNEALKALFSKIEDSVSELKA